MFALIIKTNKKGRFATAKAYKDDVAAGPPNSHLSVCLCVCVCLCFGVPKLVLQCRLVCWLFPPSLGLFVTREKLWAQARVRRGVGEKPGKFRNAIAWFVGMAWWNAKISSTAVCICTWWHEVAKYLCSVCVFVPLRSFFCPFLSTFRFMRYNLIYLMKPFFGVRLVQIQQVYWTESPYKIIEKNVLLVAMNRITMLTEVKDPRMTLSRLNSDWFIVAHLDFFLTKLFFKRSSFCPLNPFTNKEKRFNNWHN